METKTDREFKEVEIDRDFRKIEPKGSMTRVHDASSSWVMTLRVTIPNAIHHNLANAEECLREAIEAEGGPLQVAVGWCEPENVKMIGLRPCFDPTTALAAPNRPECDRGGEGGAQ